MFLELHQYACVDEAAGEVIGYGVVIVVDVLYPIVGVDIECLCKLLVIFLVNFEALLANTHHLLYVSLQLLVGEFLANGKLRTESSLCLKIFLV